MTKTLFAGRILAGAILAAAAGTLSAAPNPGASDAPPDLSGLWIRAPEPGFYPIPGDKDGKPIAQIPVEGPDASEIIAGDWTNPILQPWAREIVKANAESEMALHHVNQADDGCWPVAVPQILNLREAVHLIQTKDKVVILYQRDHQVRHIWLDRPHPAKVKPSWFGDSVGHYEGDTLVVDTIGIKTHKMSLVDTFGTPHTDKLHVVESYRPIRDDKGKGIEFTIRVEDPGTFTMPWKAMGYYRPNRMPEMLEVACAENNRDFDGSSFGTMPEEKIAPF